MAEAQPAQGGRQQFAAGDLARRWAAFIALGGAVGLAYFLVAKVAVLGLVLQPASISVFWPSAGVSSGATLSVLYSVGRPAAILIVIQTRNCVVILEVYRAPVASWAGGGDKSAT
jgi:hypothetical protein